MTLYRIVRGYRNHPTSTRILQTGLTLVEAQAHCRNLETSSSTCTSFLGRDRTKKCGPWFDGYEEDPTATRDQRAGRRAIRVTPQ